MHGKDAAQTQADTAVVTAACNQENLGKEINIQMTKTFSLTKLSEVPKDFLNVEVASDNWKEPKDRTIADCLPRGKIEITWLISYLGVTENSIKLYRDVALGVSEAYQIAIATRYECMTLKEAEIKLSLMQALGQKTPKRLDVPPFNHPETIIIIAIARLFQMHGLRRRVVNAIESDQHFYRQFKG